VDKPRSRLVLAAAQVAVLATVTAEGHPHLVPVCFVLVGDTLYSAVDDVKPKSTLGLRRLENLRVNPAASLVVHHYEEDWSALWWVRVDGSGRVVEDRAERANALQLLAGKYEQYRKSPPPGEVLALDVERWRWWP
jgi:PPOX class probable F420-dependent enzyme